jgi:hypothetical protein
VSVERGEIGPWIKAKRSNTGGQCVEMRRRGGTVEVRDSKDPEGPSLRCAKSEFAAWLECAKSGDLDHLV